MEKELYFHVDTVALLNEMLRCNNSASILWAPVNVLIGHLRAAAERATELDDPELNIAMINLGLYDIAPNDVVRQREAQEARIKQNENGEK